MNKKYLIGLFVILFILVCGLCLFLIYPPPQMQIIVTDIPQKYLPAVVKP